jgi:hypothetical protein
MGTDNWIVKTVGGEEWGFIKRLIIDSATRQISYADVIFADTGRLIRIPWEHFELQNEGIRLSISEEQINQSAIGPSKVGVAQTVAMDLWP